MRTTYQVNEIFLSVQGEGIHSGKKASFIRLQGCTVGCPWCDSGPLADTADRRTNGITRNTWGRGGTRMTVEEIALIVDEHWDTSADPHIIITGGEPTLYDLDALIMGLSKGLERAPYIQIETSGQNDLKGVELPDWVTWSPKETIHFKCAPSLAPLVDEIKFVVDASLEELTVADIECNFPLAQIVLMPEGCPPKPENIAKALEWVMRHPTWRISDRLQYRLGVR